MRKRTISAAVVALALVAAACGDDDSSSDTSAATPDTGGSSNAEAFAAPLKIGFAADLGELGAFSDQPGSEAAQVKVDQINDEGGVCGQPIEYQVKDIQGDPAATQRAAQELLDSGVNAIIGPPFTNTGLPLLDTVNGTVPVISMASTDPSLADPSRGAFLTSFSDPVQSAAVAEYLLSQGAKTAVTMSSADDVYFSGNPKYFTEAFEAGGGEVLQDYSYSLNDTDFSTQVGEIAGLETKPDVLFTAMVMGQIGTLLEQLQAADLGDVQVAGVDGFDATLVWDAGDVANGVIFAAHTFPSEDNDVQAFLDAAEAAGAQIETISFGALGADAVQILAAAAEEACANGGTLADAIANLQDVKVTTGTVTYAGTDGWPQKDVTILTVENGEPAFVTTIQPENVPAP